MGAVTSIKNRAVLNYNNLFKVKDEKALKVYKYTLRLFSMISALVAASFFIVYSNPFAAIGYSIAATTFYAISSKLKHISDNGSKNKANLSYKELVRNNKHCNALETLMKYISQDSYFKILSKSRRIYAAEKVVFKVHTLKQLGYIFSKKDLRKQMRKIVNSKDSSLVYVKNKFMSAYVKGLENYHKKNRLVKYLDDFVKEIYKNDRISIFMRRSLVKQLRKKALETSSPDKKWREFMQVLVEKTAI